MKEWTIFVYTLTDIDPGRAAKPRTNY